MIYINNNNQPQPHSPIQKMPINKNTIKKRKKKCP